MSKYGDDMAIEGNSPEVTGSGEYGATTVQLSKDGQMLRIAFGRNRPGAPIYYGAVLLSPEAIGELKSQLESLRI